MLKKKMLIGFNNMVITDKQKRLSMDGQDEKKGREK